MSLKPNLVLKFKPNSEIISVNQEVVEPPTGPTAGSNPESPIQS